jgi:hypothetical protein
MYSKELARKVALSLAEGSYLTTSHFYASSQSFGSFIHSQNDRRTTSVSQPGPLRIVGDRGNVQPHRHIDPSRISSLSTVTLISLVNTF